MAVAVPVTACQMLAGLVVPQVAEWPEDSLSAGVVMSALSQHSQEASPARAGGKGDTVAVGMEPMGAGGPCQCGWHVPALRLRAQGTQHPCQGLCHTWLEELVVALGAGVPRVMGSPGEIGTSGLPH